MSIPSTPLRGRCVTTVAAFLAVLAATLGTTVDGAGDAATIGPDRPSVLVIGDSIILGTHGNIAANLPDWNVVFDAAVSRSTADGLDVLAEHGTGFSVVVVALGANDGETPGVFAPRVAALLDALAAVPHVVWLTIHEARPYYAAANAIIRDQVARHPNAIVGDWNAAIRAGDVGGDGLHLTQQGSVDMAAWVAATVRLVSVPTTTTTTTTVPATTTTAPPTTTAPATTTSPPTVVRAAGDPPSDASQGEANRPWIIGGLVVAVVVAGVGAALVVRRRRRSADPEM